MEKSAGQTPAAALSGAPTGGRDCDHSKAHAQLEAPTELLCGWTKAADVCF